MPDIYRQLVAEVRQAAHAAEHTVGAWFDHDQPQNPTTSAAPAAAAQPDQTEGTPMSNLLNEIHDAIAEGVSSLKGWTDSIEGQLPQLAATAAKYTNSPIVQALEALGDQVLPAGIETDIANLINHFAPTAATTPATTTPADTAAPAPQPAAVPAAS